MKIQLLLLLPILTMSLSAKSIYEHDLKSIDGESTNLAEHKGKVILMVNVASRCGFTRQYKGLEELYAKYKDKGLVVCGFPCNQFGMQEPGSSTDIREFCTRNYGVSFQMMSKVDVKGNDQHPVYAWLTQEALNGSGDHKVRWNFHKFLVDGEGQLVAALGSGADPLGDEIKAFAAGE